MPLCRQVVVVSPPAASGMVPAVTELPTDETVAAELLASKLLLGRLGAVVNVVSEWLPMDPLPFDASVKDI